MIKLMLILFLPAIFVAVHLYSGFFQTFLVQDINQTINVDSPQESLEQCKEVEHSDSEGGVYCSNIAKVAVKNVMDGDTLGYFFQCSSKSCSNEAFQIKVEYLNWYDETIASVYPDTDVYMQSQDNNLKNNKNKARVAFVYNQLSGASLYSNNLHTIKYKTAYVRVYLICSYDFLSDRYAPDFSNLKLRKLNNDLL